MWIHPESTCKWRPRPAGGETKSQLSSVFPYGPRKSKTLQPQTITWQWQRGSGRSVDWAYVARQGRPEHAGRRVCVKIALVIASLRKRKFPRNPWTGLHVHYFGNKNTKVLGASNSHRVWHNAEPLLAWHSSCTVSVWSPQT